jgi:hypothetical protein
VTAAIVGSADAEPSKIAPGRFLMLIEPLRLGDTNSAPVWQSSMVHQGETLALGYFLDPSSRSYLQAP